MSGPFKMKGSPFQRNFGIGSPVKGVKVKPREGTKKKEYTTAQKKRVMELNKKHKDDPSFQAYRDKVFGGKTTITKQEEGGLGTSTVRKPV